MIIGFTNGCFDRFHDGHQFFLTECRKHVDYLIVAVNSDRYCREFKGADRPYEPLALRMNRVRMLAEAVIPVEGRALELLMEIRPRLLQWLRPRDGRDAYLCARAGLEGERAERKHVACADHQHRAAPRPLDNDALAAVESRSMAKVHFQGLNRHIQRLAQSGNLGGHGSHQLAPREWQGLPRITGDYDLDATILHRHNKDLPHRLALYTRMMGGTHLRYNPRTAYHGYSGYRGDE